MDMAVFARSEVPEQCEHLATPSVPQFAVSWWGFSNMIKTIFADETRSALMGWLLICYIPQWSRIVSRASAEGYATKKCGTLRGVC